MNAKMRWKIAVDILMSVPLLLLMAYQVVGDYLHEICGTAMLVFDFLPITSGMALARVMHLSASYWGFVLMSLHIGLHWGMMVGMFHRLAGGKRKPVLAWIACFLAVAVAVYGAVCFRHANIFSCMFVKVEFVFFDYEKSAALVFAEYIAMMGTWIFAGYYVQKGIARLTAGNRQKKESLKS